MHLGAFQKTWPATHALHATKEKCREQLQLYAIVVQLESFRVQCLQHAAYAAWANLLPHLAQQHAKHVLQDSTTLSLARHSACHVQQAPISSTMPARRMCVHVMEAKAPLVQPAQATRLQSVPAAMLARSSVASSVQPVLLQKRQVLVMHASTAVLAVPHPRMHQHASDVLLGLMPVLKRRHAQPVLLASLQLMTKPPATAVQEASLRSLEQTSVQHVGQAISPPAAQNHALHVMQVNFLSQTLVLCC